MHELAGCRVLVAEGVVDGFVVEYSAGVMRINAEEPLVGRSVGDRVTVQVLDPGRGECTYHGLLARLAPPAVDVVVMEEAGRRQRRSAARAPYRVTCVAVADPDGEARSFAVTVLDVSATGMRFAARNPVPVGSVVLVRLTTDGHALELRARVLRVDEGKSVWRHGAEFLEPDERTKERLYRLVLRLQREEIRRAGQTRD